MSHFDPLSPLQGLPEIHTTRKTKANADDRFSEIFRVAQQETESRPTPYTARESGTSRERRATESIPTKDEHPQEVPGNREFQAPCRKSVPPDQEDKPFDPKAKNRSATAEPEEPVSSVMQDLSQENLEAETMVGVIAIDKEESCESPVNAEDAPSIKEEVPALVLVGQTLPILQTVDPLGKGEPEGLEISVLQIGGLLQSLSKLLVAAERESADESGPVAKLLAEVGRFQETPAEATSAESDLLRQFFTWMRANGSILSMASEVDIPAANSQTPALTQMLQALAMTFSQGESSPTEILNRLSSTVSQLPLNSSIMMNPGMLATSVSGMSEGSSVNPLLSLINHATAAGSENLSSSNLLSTSTLEKAVPGSPLNAAKNLPSQVLLSEKMQEIPTATRIKENLQGESVLGQSANSSIPSQEQSNALAEGQGPMLEIQTVEVPSPGALRTHEFSKLAAKKEIAGTGVHLGAPKSETQTEEGKLIFSTTIKPSGFFEAELHPTLDGSLGPSTAKNVFKPSDSAGFGPKPLDRPTSPVAGAFIEKNLASQTPWSAIDKASVVSQLIDKARLLAGKHNGELVISLKPEFLGKLCLQAAMVKNELVATITTESNQVRQMLESHLPALQTSLQEQGLQVSKISVVQGNDINFSDSQQQPGNRQNPRTGGQASSMLTENQVRTEEVQDLPLHLQMQASLTSRGINLLA